ncbi:MAG: lamin tail domain-containing protein [Candidatus Omnitrophica bacterium]|nr:lamin tail domain-containing protein [Candidatus Omnitrophota bacterium]
MKRRVVILLILVVFISLIVSPVFGFEDQTSANVVINEVYYGHSVNTSWVELYNPTSKDVNLTGGHLVLYRSTAW